MLCSFQVLSPEEQILAASNNYNFDHPDAFDFGLLTHTLRKLKLGKSVKIPVYDFTTHGRQKEWVRKRSVLIHVQFGLSVLYSIFFNVQILLI